MVLVYVAVLAAEEGAVAVLVEEGVADEAVRGSLTGTVGATRLASRPLRRERAMGHITGETRSRRRWRRIHEIPNPRPRPPRQILPLKLTILSKQSVTD